MRAPQMTLIKRIYSDVLHTFLLEKKRHILLILSIILAGAALTSLAPIAIAKVITSVTSAYQQNSNAGYYIAAFILLKFLGQAVADLRWRLVNPLLYAATYRYCQSIVQRITATYRVNNGFAESASQVSERTAILSKMQIGSMSVLHGMTVVIFPAVIEIAIVMAIVYSFIGPVFIGYFMIAALILFIATGIGRAREIHLGSTAYEADNEVLSYCGEILAHSKLNREMKAEGFFKTRLDELINASMAHYHALFAQKYRRASYLTVSICIAYIMVFAWAGWLIQQNAIAGSQLFLLVVYLERVLAPVTGASAAINNIQHGLISIRAGYRLLDALQRQSGDESFMVDQHQWQQVVLSKRWVFEQQGNTLYLGVGKHIRFSGHSGVGKSTTLRRIYKHLIDTDGIEPEHVHYLSAQVEWVPGSVFDNIALGSPAISTVEIQRALELWSWAFGNRVLALRQPIDELSAGERQWVAIVRSVLRKPQVLFMDEATHSLDLRTAPLVWRYVLENISPETTLFIVTHQQSCPIRVDHDETLVATRFEPSHAPSIGGAPLSESRSHT